MRIGEKIHKLRKLKHMTLEELSKKSGVALATLSRMENDRMIGTLESHNRICKALNTSITKLYESFDTENNITENTKKNNRIEHLMSSEKIKYELLIKEPFNKKFLPTLIKIEKQTKTQQEKCSNGIEKFIYMLSGNIQITINDKQYSLKQEDSLFFDGSLPHKFINNSKKEAKLLCVISQNNINNTLL